MEKGRGILIGSTFPLSLVRRSVTITPSCIDSLKNKIENSSVLSFWGHSNTLNIARQLLSVDLTPKSERPPLTLDDNNLPVLDGVSFKECWILSPDYIPGFRPEIGKEVPPDKIIGWQVLKITWE